MSKSSPLIGQHHARPLAKCVDLKRIQDWIPEQSRRRIDIVQIWTIIKIHYCGALVGRGVCPLQCENCRQVISSMFPLDDARNAEALLTWRAKDRSAAQIEVLIASQKREAAEEFPARETDTDPLASLFPKKRAENLFLEMEKDYE